MKDFRCRHCNQLQFKWELKDGIMTIETKCYSCNTFNLFVINISQNIQTQKVEKVDINNNK